MGILTNLFEEKRIPASSKGGPACRWYKKQLVSPMERRVRSRMNALVAIDVERLSRTQVEWVGRKAQQQTVGYMRDEIRYFRTR
jgi:hypothetical protein